MPEQNATPGNGAIEMLNRRNFRSALEALARPGSRQTLQPFFDSSLLAMASVLLYAEVSFHYQGKLKDFHLLQAMTGARRQEPERCDYLFADQPDHLLFARSYPGTMECPESAATCVFLTRKEEESTVTLSGPGIDGNLATTLPLPDPFLALLTTRCHPFPLGSDLFLITANNQLIGLPRTTAIAARI